MLSTRAQTFIRVLIPSWRFFDGTVDAAVLSHRTSNDGIHFQEWIETIPKNGRRHFFQMFINSRENYLFACHALIENLKDNLVDGESPDVSIELVKNLVEFEMERAPFFQFKIECKSVEFTSKVYYRGMP